MSDPAQDAYLPEASDRLDSWKEIARYLRRGVTTVQRWEQEAALPVHRLPHAKKGSVFAYRHEIDVWLAGRAGSRHGGSGEAVAGSTSTQGDSATGSAQPPRSRSFPRRSLSYAIVATVLAAATLWWVNAAQPATSPVATSTPAAETSLPALQPVALIDSPDDERAPSLSPDGRSVAFAWTRERTAGVFVKALPDGEPELVWPFRPHEQLVLNVKWSFDGTRLAFNSLEGRDTYGLHLLNLQDSRSTRLTAMAGTGICWHPNGRSLVFADRTSTTEPFSLYALDIATRRRRRLTTPQSGAFGDTACAWHPDGERLAFSRFTTRYEADVYLIRPGFDEPPARFNTRGGGINDVTWSPDGESIVFTNHPGLKQVAADGSSPPETVAGIRGIVGRPSFSLSSHETSAALVYQVERWGFEPWVWRASEPGTSRAWESRPYSAEFPALNPRGDRVAYVRDREVWVADVTGTNHHQLTAHVEPGVGRIVTGPEWSPDGRRLAFSVPVDGQRDIYLIDADGANSFRLTTEPSLEDNPSWSSDGRWVYFRSDRGGANHIWKAPATGGPPVQVTRGEGWQAHESYDGRMVYFVRSTAQPGLWRTPAGGGDEELVLPGVMDFRWGVSRDGITYVDGPESTRPRLRRVPYNDLKRPTTLVELTARASAGFGISADGGTVFYTKAKPRQSDIMYVPAWPAR
jgi:Tol biopolymer transport system component